MIKKSLLFGFFMLLLNSTLFGQNYNYVIYDVKIDQKRFSEFISKGGFNGFEKRLYSKMLKEVNRTQIALSFNNNTSSCTPIEQLGLDDSNSKLASGGLFILLGLESAIYIDNKEKYIYTKRGRGDLVHLVKSELNAPDWTITNEERKIKNLVYKKATAKINKGKQTYSIEAWFLPSIPTQFGPGGFYGLPGLVTEVNVSDKDYSYSFLLSKIEKRKNLKVDIPLNDYKVYTDQESEELFRKLNNSRY